MGPASRTERQKTLQAGKTGLESGVGPAPENLLPERLEASPREEPTANPPRAGLGKCGQYGPYRRRHAVLEHPGDEQSPPRRFHPGGMLTAELIEAEELFHPFKHEFPLPTRPVQT
jgi:hypothetical protein